MKNVRKKRGVAEIQLDTSAPGLHALIVLLFWATT